MCKTEDSSNHARTSVSASTKTDTDDRHTAQETLKELEKTPADYIKNHPLKIIGISFLIGIVIAQLFRASK